MAEGSISTAEIARSDIEMQTTRQHYDAYFTNRENKSDTLDETITSLVRRTKSLLNTTEGDRIKTILDLGSGKQIFQRRLEKSYKLPDDVSLVSVDIANIDKSHLLAEKTNPGMHIQADGRHLPLQDASIDLIVSNLAVSFMGEQGIAEIARILKEGGKALLNMDHPKLLEKLTNGTDPSKKVMHHAKFLQESPLKFESEGDIKSMFGKHGLTVRAATVGSDYKNHQTPATSYWWEIAVEK